MKWTGEADQHLLLTILRTHTIKLDHASIAKEFGDDCTERAVVERLKTLKRLSKERAEQNGGSFTQGGEGSKGGAGSTNGTPVKSTPSKKRKAPGGGSENGTPSKKAATPKNGVKGRPIKRTKTETTPKKGKGNDNEDSESKSSPESTFGNMHPIAYEDNGPHDDEEGPEFEGDFGNALEDQKNFAHENYESDVA
ncbi:MAG: hypothetical protein M4579_000074 [Chaenotheca gracillima]|nr:MAG: hypothetical protein M4579_000074 [Chaenotheca gracillima]